MTVSSPPPPPPKPPSRARRRRARRSLTGLSRDERAAIAESLARRAYPSFRFFLGALASSLLVAASYIIDSPAILLAGLLLAPLMLPWSGVTLSIATGSARYFIQTLIALLIGGLFYLLNGVLAGLLARLWLPLPFTQAYHHSHLWWPDLLLLAFGAIWMNTHFVRRETPPALPSLVLVYGLYLPLAAAGLGLGSGQADLFPAGVLVSLVHLGWMSFFGVLTLFAHRFRPLTFLGFTFGSSIVLGLVLLLISISGLGAMIRNQLGAGAPRATTTMPIATASPTALPPTPTPLPVSPPATPTLHPSPTPIQLRTPTPNQPTPTQAAPTATPSPVPTPVYARIQAAVGNGVLVRETPPDGPVITSLMNGYLVIVFPDQHIQNGIVWVRIQAQLSDDRIIEGWVQQNWLATATPSSNW